MQQSSTMHLLQQLVILLTVVHTLGEVIIVPEVQNRDDVLHYAIHIEDSGPMVQFSKIGHLSFQEDLAIISFKKDLKPLLKRTYSLVKFANNTLLATQQNSALRKAEVLCQHFFQEAYHLHQLLIHQLQAWTPSPHDSFDILPQLDKYWTVPTELHPAVNRHYDSKDYNFQETLPVIQDEYPSSSPEMRVTRDVPNSTTSPHREPRQALVAATLGGLAGAAVSWASNKLGLTSLLGLSNDDGHNLQVIVEEEKHHIEVTRQRELHLEKELQKILAIERHITTRGSFTRVLESLENHLGVLRTEVTHTIQGLTSLLLHRLSPELISFTAVKAGVQELAAQLLKQDKRLILTNLEHVYQEEASYMFIHQNLTLFIAVALPVHGSNMLLQLFKFTPFPIPTTHNTHVIPILATPFLAVNSMTDQYRELTAADFSLCKEFNALYICPLQGVMEKATKSCLKALFSGSSPDIAEYCDTQLATRSQVVQSNRGKFNVFFASVDTLQVRCTFSNNVISRTWTGLRKLSLPEGCTATTSEVEFGNPVSVHAQGPSVTVHELSYLTLESQMDNDTIITSIQKVEEQVTNDTKEDLDNLAELLDEIKFDPSTHIPLAGLAIIVAIIGGLLCWYFCIRHRLRRCTESRIQREQAYELGNMEEA